MEYTNKNSVMDSHHENKKQHQNKEQPTIDVDTYIVYATLEKQSDNSDAMHAFYYDELIYWRKWSRMLCSIDAISKNDFQQKERKHVNFWIG